MNRTEAIPGCDTCELFLALKPQPVPFRKITNSQCQTHPSISGRVIIAGRPITGTLGQIKVLGYFFKTTLRKTEEREVCRRDRFTFDPAGFRAFMGSLLGCFARSVNVSFERQYDGQSEIAA